MRRRRSRRSAPLPMLQLARLGALAPSRQNTQPWKFSIQKDSIRILPDFSRRLTVVDPTNQGLYLSLGCVAENILIAAEHFGFRAELDDLADSEDGSLLIRFTPRTGYPAAVELMSGMALRQCNRRAFSRERLFRIDLNKLTAASRLPGVNFGVVTEKKQIERIAEVVSMGQREKVLKLSSILELARWTRFSKSEAQAKRDGVLFTEMGYPPLPRHVGLLVLLGLAATNLQARRSISLIRSSSALMFFAPHTQEKRDWFNVGRSFQRVVLTAATLRIRYAHLQLPYCAPVDARLLADCLGCDRTALLIVARLGYSELGSHSFRRPLSRLLANG